MKYLFTLTYYYPYISGVTLYIKRLIDHLPKNIIPTVLCMNHQNLPEYEDSVIRAKPDVRISKGFLSFDWFSKFITQMKTADKVFVSLPQFEALFSTIICKAFNKPYFVIYHCDIILPKSIFNSVVQIFIDVSTLVTLVFAHKIISYTKDYAINSKFLKHFQDKVVYSYPPIPQLKGLNSRKNPVFTIGVAARLAEEKGIEYLLKAIEDIDCQLLVAGPENPVGEEAYQAKIKNLVTSKVKFVGTYDPDHMNQFYSRLDVLVLPSVNMTESFGMVQVEAMMCGVPVIATNLPGVRTVIQTTNNGIIVEPRNSDALKQALVAIKTIKVKSVTKTYNLNQVISFYENIS